MVLGVIFKHPNEKYDIFCELTIFYLLVNRRKLGVWYCFLLKFS